MSKEMKFLRQLDELKAKRMSNSQHLKAFCALVVEHRNTKMSAKTTARMRKHLA
jgi:hypothetical protein